MKALTPLALILLTLLTSCSKTDSWRNSSIKTGSKEFDSARLVYPSSNYTHDYQLEFVYSDSQLNAYLNLFSARAPTFKDDKELTQLKFIVNGKQYETVADRLSGGQRIRLPADSMALLIKLLEDHKTVTIHLKETMKFTIYSDPFKKHFKALKAKPLLFIPNDPVGIAL